MRIIESELARFETLYSRELETGQPFLKPLLEHVRQARGKRLRPALYFLTQGLFGKPEPSGVSLAVMLELLHAATLIHDDVVDESFERRGTDTVNRIWGNRVSILLGDYLFARVLALGVHASPPGVLNVVSRVVQQIGEGELQHVLAGEGRLLSETSYFRIIRAKTAVLFGAAAELAVLAMEAGEEEQIRFRDFGTLFGLAFQIRDDILDYTGESGMMGKPAGQDLKNGKVTLPLIYALERTGESERKQIQAWLAGADPEGHENIRAFIEINGGFLKAGDKVRSLTREAEQMIQDRHDSPYKQALAALMQDMTERLR